MRLRFYPRMWWRVLLLLIPVLLALDTDLPLLAPKRVVGVLVAVAWLSYHWPSSVLARHKPKLANELHRLGKALDYEVGARVEEPRRDGRQDYRHPRYPAYKAYEKRRGELYRRKKRFERLLEQGSRGRTWLSGLYRMEFIQGKYGGSLYLVEFHPDGKWTQIATFGNPKGDPPFGMRFGADQNIFLTEQQVFPDRHAGEVHTSPAIVLPTVQIDEEVYDRLIAEGVDWRVARSKAKAAWIREQQKLIEKDGA
jgi:hypothetical protein